MKRCSCSELIDHFGFLNHHISLITSSRLVDTNSQLKFPYALDILPSTLAQEWDSPEFRPYRDAFPAEHRTSPKDLEIHARYLMSQDLKIPYLKSLQGYLWIRGYETGALRCPLFSDVYPSLQAWTSAGKKVVIYSSGSVAAQKLLFQYTDVDGGKDVRGLLSAYFDTTNAGMKNHQESYEKIARELGVAPGKFLFASDNALEVEAAIKAGMRAVVVVRPGNAPLTDVQKSDNAIIDSFEALKLS